MSQASWINHLVNANTIDARLHTKYCQIKMLQ